ncbi:MAG: hypothetical protein PQJ59_16110 [Spirochaetales bacterium]|nr:hypothetical protein [Spirochaetales bacterium]
MTSIKYGLCYSCFLRFKWDNYYPCDSQFCLRCGIKLLGEKDICLECREDEFPLCNSSLYPYRGVFKDLIQYYKFDKEKRLALFFASQIDSCLRSNGYLNYTLVPIPPEKGKKFRTGWDQVELIISYLKKWGWSTGNYFLKEKGQSQKSLNREERQIASAGRFYLMKNISLPPRIMIIDDVFTTGSTLKECYKILNGKGLYEIRSLTIVRD